MLGISAFLLGGLFLLPNFVRSADLGDDFCVRGEPPARQIIIVIDRTDPFDHPGRNTIKNRIKGLIEATIRETKKGEKISLFSFSGSNERRFPPLVQACSPGGWKEHNHWLENQEKVETDYGKFSKQLFTAPIEQVTRDAEFVESPIIEALTDIATREEFIQSGAGNRMIMVSDMIQNSESVKFYDYRTKKAIDHSDEEITQTIQSIAGARGLDLAKFDIEVHELFHEQHPAASDEVRKIWERILKARVKSMTWKLI